MNEGKMERRKQRRMEERTIRIIVVGRKEGSISRGRDEQRENKLLKTGLLKEKTQEMLCVGLFVAMYLGEYLIAQTPASVTVLGFHEADVNSVIGLVGIDLFYYMSTVQHETQIPFYPIALFSAQ